MSETALKFGPEWLRVLSHGGSVSSPPPSPGVNKMKRAEHRYGREEMLALFNKHQSPPDGMQALGSLYVDKAQEPLAFIPMNEEEQRMWQRGVNSDVVLRQAGRAPVNGVGRGRGGSVDRGRGRGRGTGSYYTRGLSYDEEVEPRGPKEGGPPGIGIRGKSYERSQSVHEQRLWSERASAGTVPGVGVVPEDRNGAVSPRKEQGRASTENWRSRAGEGDDSERWRGAGGNRSEKWGPRGWRERENGLEGEWEEGLGRGSTRGMPASARGMRQPWDDKDGHFRKSWDEDNLPEWYIVRSTENPDEKGGSFDASGAFHGPGWSDEEEPTAEGRGCGPGRPRQKSSSPDKSTLPPENSGTDKAEGDKNQEDSEAVEERAQRNGVEEEPQPRLSPINGMDSAQSRHPPVDSIPTEVHFFKIYGATNEESQGREENRGSPNETEQSTVIPEPMVNGVASEEETSSREAPSAQGFQGEVGPIPVQAQNSEEPEPVPGLGREHQGEEEKLEHMRSVADDLVAKLVEEDDPRPRSNNSNPGVTPPGQMGPMPDPGAHPAQTPGEDKWYYTDPQGEIQGPFSSSDMAEWYKAGYFTPSLLLKRECDDQFAQLGDLTRVFGRVPFVPGPPVPPIKVPELLAAQKQQAERERIELLRTYMLQKQVYEQQIAASRQQVLQKLQSLEEWSSLSPIQQQQLFMQHMPMIPAHPPIPPTVPPSTAIPQTTQVSAPIPDPRIVAGPDPRILPGPAGPPASKPQDPIQALVAQMQTSPAPSSTAMTSSCDGLLNSQLTATSMVAENPLQKLLMQLQRGQQPGMGPMGGPVGPLGVGLAGAAGVAAPPVATPVTTVPTIEKPPEQPFDAIQSLMQQLTSMQAPSQEQMQEEQRRRDEDQKRLEEERKLLEDQKRAEEERIKMEELRLKEELKRQEEQRRSLEALRRQHEEEAQRLEEERRKIMEEQIRRQEEMRRIEEEKARKEEEQKKLKDQQMNEAKRRQEEQLRRQEEHRRQQEQQQQHQQQQQQQQQQQLLHQQQQQQLLQQKQQEEVAKRKEEARRQEELRRQQQEEERKRQEEERKRREEEEEEARQQAHIQEEMRRIALEEERRHMQQVEEEERQRQAEEEDRRHQHLLQEHLKNILPAWNAQSPAPAPEAAPAPSLADIQRAQEEKERREREVELQMQQQRQREAQRQAAEEARQKNSGLKWAAKAQANPSPAPVKSLLEIQAEEEKELKKRQEKEAAERAAAVSHMSLGAAGVWGSAISNLSWASRASSVGMPAASHQSSQQWGGNSGGQSSGGGLWNNTSQPPTTTTSSPGHSVWNNDHSSIWNHADNSSSTGGFWDNPEPSKPKPASGRTPTKPNNQNHGRGGASGAQHNNNTNARVNKKKGKDESDTVKKLFTENVSQADNFTQWCKSSLNTMKVHASIDIPTFVTFLAEVESPYEVHDYIRSYLGDSKEVKEFAKQYLERRSKARNAQKEREVEDDILAPAPAVNPTTSEFQEVKARSKKANKKKMQKVDSSILGFSVTSNERINVGEREYAE